MINREKVIKELESLRDICNAKSNMAIGKGKVAWAGYANTADDAIALLKEQGKKKFFVDSDGKITPLPDVVRCKDCKHRPKEPNFKTYVDGFDIEFPEGSKCPCKCSGDEYYSWYPEDDWFCADGERKESGEVE